MGPVRPIREENEMGRARGCLHVHAPACMIMQMDAPTTFATPLSEPTVYDTPVSEAVVR